MNAFGSKNCGKIQKYLSQNSGTSIYAHEPVSNLVLEAHYVMASGKYI
jgi:hypothetical protein